MEALARWREIWVTVTPQADLVLFANGATKVIGAGQAETVVAMLRAMFATDAPELEVPPPPELRDPLVATRAGRGRTDGLARRGIGFYYQALAECLHRKNSKPFTGVELAFGHGGFDSGFTSFVYRAKKRGYLVKVSSGKKGRYQVTQAGLAELARHVKVEEKE